MTTEEKYQTYCAKRSYRTIVRCFDRGESVDDIAYDWGVPIVVIEDIIRRNIERMSKK